MSAVVLGVDPGIKHTGWSILTLDTGRVMARGTIELVSRRRVGLADVLTYLDHALAAEVFPRVADVKVAVAGVEEVNYFGRAKRVVIPLAHVSGFIVGTLRARGIPTYIIAPAMKGPRDSIKCPVGWTEHEKDARTLARIARACWQAAMRGDKVYLKKHAALVARLVQ